MMNRRFNHHRHNRSIPLACLVVFMTTLVMLAGCDPGGRLSQLTPPPAATPMILGVTAEAPIDANSFATAQPESLDNPLVIKPTALYDSSRPAWTILYYAGADNGRGSFIWDDLNEMESAGLTDQVRVVAQVDWSEGDPTGFVDTSRYLIRPDNDPERLASEVVESLGETNMGDPATLANFLVWGMTTYPANRYALILSDFGGGWQGCCYDETTGTDIINDRLSLSDIDQALAAAYNEMGGVSFEVIAFAAGLMGQLDVLQTIQPYGAYAVVSAGLMPGSSWDFQPVIAQLNANPLADGQQLSGDLVAAYVNYQRQIAGDENVGMAAVNLARVPALTAATEALADTLLTDPALYGAIAADARRGAQRYGNAALTDAEWIASVDLQHAAALIAENAPPGELQGAALAVSQAVSDSLVAYDHGQAIPYGRGIAIYWPVNAQSLNLLYPYASRLPAWATFLGEQAPATVSSPLVTVDGGSRQSVSIANPAMMRAEIVGQRLDEVVLMADQEAADGRRVLRQYEIVQPSTVTLSGGTNTSLWGDGHHESLIIWDATASYLSDRAGAGDFVPLRPVDPSPIGALSATGGVFLPYPGRSMEATVVFRPDTPHSLRLWAAADNEGARLIGEIQPVAGNVFQPTTTIINPDGSLVQEPGVALIFDDTGAIYRSSRPLPGGQYSVGIGARTLGESLVSTMKPLVVDPGGVAAGFRAFVDINNNVQFLYPADWLSPTTQEDIAYTNNIDNTAQLQARFYPNWANDLAALQDKVLNTFGNVSVLLQEPVPIGVDSAVEGVRTAYGYDSTERGARTGMFLTFMKDGTGYVVDMDAPRNDESTALAIVDTIAATWQFLPERLGFGPEQWATLTVADFRVKYPLAYEHQEFNNWHRFTKGSQTFVAARLQPAGRTPAEAISSLLQTASEDVLGFAAEEPQRLFYGGHVWERNDFHYTDINGSLVSGLLLSRQDGNTEITVWAEALEPAGELLQSVFLPVAASIERIPVAPSG